MKLFKGLNEEQLHNIGGYVKTGCKFAAYAVVAVLSCSSVTDEIFRKIRYTGDVDYSDAVNAIMHSDMMSSYKRDAVEALPKDKDCKFYKSIIHVVSCDMMSSYKVDLIKRMGEKN